MSRVGGAYAMPNKWWLDEAVLPGGLILGGEDGTFSEDQQEKFGVDAAGNVKDQAAFQTAVEKVRGVRERITADKLKIYTVNDLHQDQWLPKPHAIIHLKGFGGGLNATSDRAVLRDISRSKCKMMVWDGDPFDETGFTKLVPKFLEENPQSKALAFKLDYEVDNFKESWEKIIEQFPDRIRLVAIDMKPPIWHDAAEHGITDELKGVQDLPDWAQEYFLLGRLACKLTGSKTVFSLGGGGISAYEAKAAANAGMKWTIYAMSRGRKEAYPTLADWAAENPGPGVSLRRDLDPDEKNAFCKEENKKQNELPVEHTMAHLLEKNDRVPHVLDRLTFLNWICC